MFKVRFRTEQTVLSCVIITLLVSQGHSADPVYSNATISDASGNTADQDAVITWADLPAGSPYKAGTPSRISEGLEPYYNFMHSFVGSVFPQDIPDSVIENIANGTIDKIVTNYSEYINVFLGYAVCVAVGVLFIFIFPIVMCCFCCCRCCGNCGGKMIQKDKDAENKCKRNTFAILLAIMLAFITVGMICAFLNNDNTTKAIEGISSTAKDNIEVLKIFVNNTVEQANHIARNNYEFLKAALFRDIDNIGYLVGIPLRTDIETNTNIEAVLAMAYDLNNDLTQAAADLEDVNSKLTNLDNSLDELNTALTAVRNNLDDAFSTCGCSGGPDYSSGTAVGVDSSQFPDLSSQTQSMSDATNQNLTEKVAEAEQELDSIPWAVHNDSETSRDDMKTSIENLKDDIDPMLDKIDNINDMIYGANATIDLNKYEDLIEEYGGYGTKYNKYRWYGGIGLVCIVLLIVILGILGLVFGMMGCNTSINPPDRGCLSNSGGNLLIGSAVFIAIFSALLMLLTTLTFILGAPVERYVCKTTTDPSLTQLEKWVDGTYNRISAGDGNYFLGDMLYQNSSVPLTVTGILRSCKESKAAFEAFQLGSQFDITDILNYSKTLDVDSEIDQVNVDLSGVEVYPASLQIQLTDLKNAIDINFTKFYEELNKSPTGANLSALADDLDSYAANIGGPFEAAIKNQTDELRRIETEEVVYVYGNITALNVSVTAMETTVSGLPANIDSIEDGLNSTEQYIQNNGSHVVKSLLRIYADRLTDIADSYVSYTDNAVRSQLGACLPVWNIYDSFMVYTFCYNLMDTFNGFWFSLGWCIFFFIPGFIFSMKYAKFLRRMNFVPADEIPPKQDRPLPTPEVVDSNHKPMFNLRKNKVAHHDGTGCKENNQCSGMEYTASEALITNSSLNKTPDGQSQDHFKTGLEHAKIYPDLSNNYSEPHVYNAGDIFTLTDSIAFIKKEESYNSLEIDNHTFKGLVPEVQSSSCQKDSKNTPIPNIEVNHANEEANVTDIRRESKESDTVVSAEAKLTHDENTTRTDSGGNQTSNSSFTLENTPLQGPTDQNESGGNKDTDSVARSEEPSTCPSIIDSENEDDEQPKLFFKVRQFTNDDNNETALIIRDETRSEDNNMFPTEDDSLVVTVENYDIEPSNTTDVENSVLDTDKISLPTEQNRPVKQTHEKDVHENEES